MKREFVLNLVFLILINLLIKPLYIFGVDVGVQNAVGAENYGLYFYLLGFIYLFQFINDFGIQNFNNRFISLNETLLGKYFPHIFSLKLLLGLVFFTVVLGMGLVFDIVQTHPLLFCIIALNLFLDALNGYMRSNVAGLGWYRRDSILSVTDKIIMILVCGGLLLHAETRAKFQIEWFAIAQTVSFLTVTLLSSWWLRKKIQQPLKWAGNKYFLLVFRKSWPFALILITTFFYNRLDGVMLGLMLEDGSRQAGYYAAGFRLYDAASMFTFLFAGLLYPMFSKMLSRGEDPSQLYRFGIQLLWLMALGIALVFLVFPREIMNFLYRDPGPDAATVLAVLGLAFVAKSIFHLSGSLMLSFGDLKNINLIFATGMILNFLLNYAMIPIWGIIGACWATLITQGLVALGLFLRTISLTKKVVNWSTLVKGLLIGAVFVLLGAGLNANPWDWGIQLRLIVLIILLLIPTGVYVLKHRAQITGILKGKF